MKRVLILTFFLAFLHSCSDDDVSSVEIDEPDIWSVNKPNQYALNVVIFKPTDGTAEKEMIDKVSTMMLYIQKWFEKQMDMQGYGRKTFGLMTNQHGKVKITVVSGSESSVYYKNNNRDVNKEVKKYFENHPNERLSNHIFVLGKDDSGVPFYGLGKNAFATSKDFSLTSTGKFLDDLELMLCDKLGGIMHELGHGLNLPHCAHKASDLPNISLMSFGNHTYQNKGKSDLVFLTASDCAILNASETFNTKEKQYYQEGPSPKLVSYTVVKDNTIQATIVEGLLTSSVKSNHLYVGHNGYPIEGGYDDITFTTDLTPTSNTNEYSFRLEMPYSDIFNGYKAKDLLQMTLVVITDDGIRKTLDKYDYTIRTNTLEPNDDILRDYTPFVFSDRSNWTVTTNSSSAGTSASLLLDGNIETYWHSIWPYAITEKGSHVVTVNMNKTDSIKGVYFKSDRQGKQYRPKEIIIDTSNDGTTWRKRKDVSISSIGNARELEVYFDSPVNTKYIRMTVDEVYASSGNEENLLFNEIDIVQ
ncbi:discoidin domain-containing protein [Aureibaculum conchae]|uniref:discoidin domain-containing protein n=1 Tax=Aureibaculum sp. 2308TA14-22 TaxID=3108392 RepID=UPI003392926C